MEKRPAAGQEGIFASFFMGGFECSTHLRAHDRARLDLVHSTRHDEFAFEDYARLHTVGIRVARDGIRWHVIEKTPGQYDWSSVPPVLRAAKEAEVQVIWDILHFGWPDHVDVFAAEFPERFARFAGAFARIYSQETDEPAFFAPGNEISFLSFAAGEEGFFNPFVKKRGDEIKKQFVRATIAAIETIREVLPDARFVHTDPII
ncbi:MAG: beta-glucosidase, partial [Verrucomicrobiae bacterium]|nr:beta-glucosidase [Verrucomicrobiae bacterium]